MPLFSGPVMLLNILSTLFPIFGVIFLGAFAARTGLLPLSTAQGLNAFVYWIGLPALMLHSLARMDAATMSGAYFFAVYAGLLGSYLACYALVSGGFRRRSAEADMLSFLACFPNAAFMGVATVSFLLPGDAEAVAAASLCAVIYMPVMLYTDSKLEMNRHKGERPGQVLRSLGRAVVRNPMLIAAVAGLGISLSGLAAPLPFLNMAAMLGSTTAPCALFAMGMVLAVRAAALRRPAPGWAGRQIPVHGVKLLLFPLLSFLALRFSGVSGVLLGVTTLIAGMPIGVVAYVVAEKFQTAVEDTSLGIFVNTALSMVSIPLVISLLYQSGAFSR